ncbi:MAG TPA: SH3 domain-containing protein, partial [Anaerolineales bacterium]|nr:SH3 domain-containing protein [Anaerolineales bacterium]
MTAESGPKKRSTRRWAPVLLILPSLIYLALFFAWPMMRGLVMSVWEEGAILTLRTQAQEESPPAGQLPRGAPVRILDQQANVVPPEELVPGNLITEVWFLVRGQDPDGRNIEGWTPERRIRVRAEDENGAPITGSVRTVLSSTADPLTGVYAEPDANSEIVGRLEAQTAVEILDQTTLEVWFLINGDDEDQPVEGWAQSRYIQMLGESSLGRIDRGDTGQFTTVHIEKMVNDRFFVPALTTTLLLILIIIPVQFVLAIIMALVIQANPRGTGLFLYIFAIALGVSDLAVGIVWYSIFTQLGYLNS